MAQKPHSHNFPTKGVLTFKISTDDLTLLSKALSDLQAKYKKILSASSILVNSENHLFFAYVNISNDVALERLQEITPTPYEVRSTQP